MSKLTERKKAKYTAIYEGRVTGQQLDFKIAVKKLTKRELIEFQDHICQTLLSNDADYGLRQWLLVALEF